MSKSAKYYYDYEAIKEPAIESNASRPRMGQGPNTQYSQKRNRATFRGGNNYTNNQSFDNSNKTKPTDTGIKGDIVKNRNKRSVWTIPTYPCKDAHFATYPPKLIEPCILAGCPAGGVVLDPFMGSGTTAKVAIELGRNYVGCELNPEYIKLINKRIKSAQPPLFT